MVSKTTVLSDFSQARTKEILCKPVEEQSPPLTTGSSPVDQRYITGTRSALRCCLLTSIPTPICLCKVFSYKACPGKYNHYNQGNTILKTCVLKPGHTASKSGRRGARRMAGRDEAGQNSVPTFRSPQKPTVILALQGTVNNCSERLIASTNKGNPM